MDVGTYVYAYYLRAMSLTEVTLITLNASLVTEALTR